MCMAYRFSFLEVTNVRRETGRVVDAGVGKIVSRTRGT